MLLRAGTNTSGRGTQKAASLSCGRTDRQTAYGRAGCQAWVLEPVSQSPSQSRGPLQNAECFTKQTEAAVLGACCWWLFASFQRGFSHLSHPAPAGPLTPYPTQLSWHRSSPGWAPKTTCDAGTAGPQLLPPHRALVPATSPLTPGGCRDLSGCPSRKKAPRAPTGLWFNPTWERQPASLGYRNFHAGCFQSPSPGDP